MNRMIHQNAVHNLIHLFMCLHTHVIRVNVGFTTITIFAHCKSKGLIMNDVMYNYFAYNEIILQINVIKWKLYFYFPCEKVLYRNDLSLHVLVNTLK